MGSVVNNRVDPEFHLWTETSINVSFFSTGISDTVPRRFLLQGFIWLQAGSNTTTITRHHCHHFGTMANCRAKNCHAKNCRVKKCRFSNTYKIVAQKIVATQSVALQ
jgi:hypothetical protein